MLWQHKQELQQVLARELDALSDEPHIIDGIPIPLCCFTRAPGCRSFRGKLATVTVQQKKKHITGFMVTYSLGRVLKLA